MTTVSAPIYTWYKDGESMGSFYEPIIAENNLVSSYRLKIRKNCTNGFSVDFYLTP